MIAVLLSCILSGCFQPRDNNKSDNDAATRPTELFETNDNNLPPPNCLNDPSPLTALRIRVRTSAPGGRFAPRNVGAIWIEDRSGNYVKTVARWGTVRAKWLKRFGAASLGNIVDAVTGPTLISHQSHDVRWNLTGADRCEVPGGDYRVVFELTDRDGVGPTLDVPFVKALVPSTTAAADDTYFHDLVLDIE